MRAMMAAMNHVALDYRITMMTMILMNATIRNRNDFDVVIFERVSTSSSFIKSARKTKYAPKKNGKKK